MQIFGTDYYDRSVICSGKAAVSIFFQIDDTSTNTFFDWIANATAGGDVYIDLNRVLPKTTSATNNMYGYDGTDTMPDCGNVCWYAVETPLKMTQAEHDYFVYEQNASNARQTGLGSS